ncbi:MAG TPA: hypothetical protein VFV23_07550 [Verrucomicrobiae bacterium]|nr:hypothetical protein [Verrucomicrobiae bacterium]
MIYDLRFTISRLSVAKWFSMMLLLALLIPACGHSAESITLAGQWRFALDRNDVGISEKWFSKKLADKIQLPGILQAQGYGDDISTNTPWVLTLGDAWWKLQSPELRKHFSQPGHMRVPFLAQPPKHYLGAAWYQRDFEIPKNWNGRHFTLFLERVHWKSTVWLDDKEIGSDISLGTPHEYDFGIVAPGKHRVTICVDNRTQLPVAHHLLDSHSISDALGAAWNGIVGKIQLISTPPVWIEDVQVFPNIETKSALIKVKIGNATGETGSGKLSCFSIPQDGNLVFVKSHEATVDWKRNGAEIELDLPLLPDDKQWDEFDPVLQRLNLRFKTKYGNDSTETFFGLRQIATRDKDILLNGRPINLRMTHFGGDFPMTGYPAMDIASWKKIFQTCKDYGLNGMRFHSWCPPEAAFEAADELGFYLAPECGLWADFGNEPTRAFLTNETARILKNYGNHPSFILLSPSNEPRNYQHFTPEWAAANYARDNRRLYAADSGWGDPAQVAAGGAQYAVLARFSGGNLRGPTGWFGRDYRDALEKVHIPVLAHEVGQWCAYPDFDVMREFTGYLQPGNYDIFKYIAKEEGVLDEDKDFAQASGRFQLECYKEEIEANLRTPGLAGFQLLDLHDYLGQGTALIGVLDAFWQSKGYATPEEFRHFCSPVVPLVWLKKRTFTTDEKLEANYGVANFGSRELENATFRFAVLDDHGKDVGSIPPNLNSDVDVPAGFKGKCGGIIVDLAGLPAPASYKLVVAAGSANGGNFTNTWNFWLYPAQVKDSKTADVLVTTNWSDAEKKLSASGKVLFMPTEANLDLAKCPPMKNVPIFWNIQMTVRPPQNPRPRFDAFLGLLCQTDSAALAEFPTDKNCDWQWTALINNVRAINLETMPRELKPIVWCIDDWNRNWKLGVIFECNVGRGKLLVSAINLIDDERGGQELKQLRRSLLDYMGGNKFHPPTTVSLEQIRALWSGDGSFNPVEQKRVFDPDLDSGSETRPAQRKN